MITGTGIIDDPWIIETLDDLKTCWVKTAPDGVTGNESTYIKFKPETVIDCNDYGSDFEWTTLTTNGFGVDVATYLDMNGSTIKNVMIANGAKLFVGRRATNTRPGYISNGKLLNIFSNNASGITALVGLDNMSVSVNGTTLTGSAFAVGGANLYPITNSAIYYKSSQLLDTIVYGNSADAVKNTDFYFDIEDVNAHTLMRCASTSNRFDGVRVRGRIAGNCSGLLLGTLTSSVIELDATTVTTQITVFEKTTNNGTIVNTELLPEWSVIQNAIACTSQEMRDANALIAKGFNVVEVGE